MIDDPLQRLSAVTYEVRHNPNCPSPYLIVTGGDAFQIGAGYSEPRNFFSYGKTLAEAVEGAVIKIEHRASLARIRGAERKLTGVVCA